MSIAYRLTVYCRPEPQGSKKAYVRGGKVRLVENCKKVAPYRQQVAQTAISEGVAVIERPGAVLVWVEFYLKRPPSIPKGRKWPTVKPDIDKLLRATLDALTGIAWQDDAQVVKVRMSKHYGEPERVEIQWEAF